MTSASNLVAIDVKKKGDPIYFEEEPFEMEDGCFFLQRTSKNENAAKFRVVAALSYWNWDDQYFCIRDEKHVPLSDGCNVACVLVELDDFRYSNIEELDASQIPKCT